MYPGMLYAWKRARKEARRQMRDEMRAADCAEKRGRRHEESGYEAAGGSGAGMPFGVRRPLRFMAKKLELDAEQVKALAGILNDLKTERAQAEVDHRRTISAVADALDGADFDEEQAAEGLARRVKSAENLRDAVLKALERTHEMLNEEQRAKLAYLLRSGQLSI